MQEMLELAEDYARNWNLGDEANPVRSQEQCRSERQGAKRLCSSARLNCLIRVAWAKGLLCPCGWMAGHKYNSRMKSLRRWASNLLTVLSLICAVFLFYLYFRSHHTIDVVSWRRWRNDTTNDWLEARVHWGRIGFSKKLTVDLPPMSVRLPACAIPPWRCPVQVMTNTLETIGPEPPVRNSQNTRWGSGPTARA